MKLVADTLTKCEPYINPDVGVGIDFVRVYILEHVEGEKSEGSAAGVYLYGEVCPTGSTPRMVEIGGPLPTALSLHEIDEVVLNAVLRWRASI